MSSAENTKQTEKRAFRYIYFALALIIALLFGAYLITTALIKISPITFLPQLGAFALACVALFGYKVLPKWLKNLFFVGMAVFLASFTAFAAYIHISARIGGAVVEEIPEDERATLIVFGCYVRDEEPGTTLQLRLSAALQLLERFPHSDCIVTGAQGENEGISEAAAMKNWLVSHGISEERIMTEERSRDTLENLRYSFEILDSIPEKSRVIGVSSSYHLARIRMLSRSLGREIDIYPASDRRIGDTVIYTLREYMAVIKMFLGI